MKLIGVFATAIAISCVSASAQTVNYTKRMKVADGPTWTYCLNMSANSHDCVLKPDPNVPCPDGYGIGGVVWTSKAAACAAGQQTPGCGYEGPSHRGTVRGC